MSAAITASVVGGGIAAYGASEQAGAAGDAAKAQEQMGLQGLIAQQKATAAANRRLNPFLDTGYESNALLNYLMGFGQPTDMAKTESNFDAEAYRNFLVERARDNLSERIKNPAKLEKKLAKRTAAIDKRLETTGAWKDYKQRIASGKMTDGEFWKQRQDAGLASGAGKPGFGFLMQRFNNDVFEKDPGYQFRLDEGAKAVEGSAAARGGLLSGAAAKAMQKYGQGYASNEYANAYNRFTTDQSNLYSRAMGLQDVGMRAAGAQGGNLMTQGQQAAQMFSNIGDVRASGIMGAANARASGYSNIGNTAMDIYGQFAANKQQNAMMDRMYPQQQT